MNQKYPSLGFGYTWWQGDPLPELPGIDDFRVAASDDTALLARLHRLNTAEMEKRLREGNLAYLAYLGPTPVAYGWSASKKGQIQEVGLEWLIPPGNRHLWDFKTLPEWRGRGIYPQLLQAIIRRELPQASRFWIGHQAGNLASRRGILKAGFQLCQIGVLTPQGGPKAVIRGDPERAKANPMARAVHFEVIDLPDELIDFDPGQIQLDLGGAGPAPS